MSRLKLPALAAALTLAVTALAGCTGTEQQPPAEKPAATLTQTPPTQTPPTPVQPAADSTPEPTDEDVCWAADPSISLIQDGENNGHSWNEDGGTVTGLFEGEMVDLGPRDNAAGTVQLNEAGEIVSYTVAPNDVYEIVAKRFCFSYYDIITYNTGLEPLLSRAWHRGIEPGDVLILRPDPTVEWKPKH